MVHQFFFIFLLSLWKKNKKTFVFIISVNCLSSNYSLEIQGIYTVGLYAWKCTTKLSTGVNNVCCAAPSEQCLLCCTQWTMLFSHNVVTALFNHQYCCYQYCFLRFRQPSLLHRPLNNIVETILNNIICSTTLLKQ